MSNETPTDALRLVPVSALEEVRDLLLERIHGNPARSAGHNARLAVEAILAAPASPLPGGGDWIDGTPEVPVGSPTWCGWASYEIRRLRSALPAAPTGDA